MQLTFFDTPAEETRAANMRRGLGYAATLAEVLGNGAEWEYRGECNDLGQPSGKCCCGHHGIRFEFALHHPDGRGVIVGSTCVTTFQGISPDVVARIQADVERLEAEARERIAAAKRAAQDQQIQERLALLHSLSWQLDELLAAVGSDGYGRPARRLTFCCWQRWYGATTRLRRRDGEAHPCVRIKPYRVRSAMLRAIDKRIQEVESWIRQPYE